MADGRRSKDVDDGGSGGGGGDDDEGLEGEDLERALWLGTQRVRNRMRDADEAAGADGARGVVQTPRPARLLLLRAGAAPRPARLLLLRAGVQACAGASRGVVETAEDGDRDPEHKRQKALVSGDRLQQEELESAICRFNILEILNVHSCPKINARDFGRIRMVCPVSSASRVTLSHKVRAAVNIKEYYCGKVLFHILPHEGLDLVPLSVL